MISLEKTPDLLEGRGFLLPYNLVENLLNTMLLEIQSKLPDDHGLPNHMPIGFKRYQEYASAIFHGVHEHFVQKRCYMIQDKFLEQCDWGYDKRTKKWWAIVPDEHSQFETEKEAIIECINCYFCPDAEDREEYLEDYRHFVKWVEINDYKIR